MISTELPTRPKVVNKTGVDAIVKLNTWTVNQFPSRPIYQYDVAVGKGEEKPGTIRAMWESKKVKKELGPGWIFDNKALAWSGNNLDKEMRIDVDLNEEEGRTGKASDANKKRFVIRKTKQVNFSALRAWLDRKASFDVPVMEAINFLDHLMRETPTKQLIAIKRNFFNPNEARFELGGGIQAAKGAYASIRPVLSNTGQPSLSVNLDVANTTFWVHAPLTQVAAMMLNCRDPAGLITYLGSDRGDPQNARLNALRPLRIQITTSHLGHERSYKIGGFSQNSRTYKFDHTDEATGLKRTLTMEQYFKQKYNITLRYPGLPVVLTTKTFKTLEGKTVFIALPFEICIVKKDQRYALKLNDQQTSKMITFAVTQPKDRWHAIENGKNMLKWDADPYLKNYGLVMAAEPTKVKAKVLPNPKVAFANAKGQPLDLVNPGVSGRWDLRGKRFVEKNTNPLKSWGVLVAPGRGQSSQQQAQAFVQMFVQIYTGHGGQIVERQPTIQVGGADIANSLANLWTAVGNKAQSKPQILFIIVPSRDAALYNRIKKNGECRFGVVTQVLQSNKMERLNPQYCSNVAMKVNAKLGGSNMFAQGVKGAGGWFTRPTMIIGADVSHGGAGMMTPSVAAITASKDQKGIKYTAGVQTNGVRIEMITTNNIRNILGPTFTQWKNGIGGGKLPEHIIYFRDGVSEGQYVHVLNQEVADMKNVLKEIAPKNTTKFTVVVATKRHHVRFFPEKGDKVGNPLPGTIVESGVTHPFEYDFYLCSHVAIKGTARPVHYHVILDEASMEVENLQNMIYEHSYQYVRSTTPVSLHPAVYYAHLATNRGIAHIDKAPPSETASQAQMAASDVAPLTPMHNDIRTAMWYV